MLQQHMGKECPVAWIGASPSVCGVFFLIACARYCMQSLWSVINQPLLLTVRLVYEIYLICPPRYIVHLLKH